MWGAVSTISAFKTIKDKSEAHFHAILEGLAYSAGSAFFLMCDTQEVGEFAEMMIHTSQGSGFYSHSQGRKEYGDQAARTAEKLVRNVYSDFLTEDEITDVLKGAEIWLDSDQIRERLQRRQTIREQRVVDEMKSQYTPEYYVQEILPDIAEDCEGLGYDLKQVLQMLLQSVENLEEGCTEISLDEVEGTQDIDVLKSVAKVMVLKHPHNIGIEKLRAKILNQLED